MGAGRGSLCHWLIRLVLVRRTFRVGYSIRAHCMKNIVGVMVTALVWGAAQSTYASTAAPAGASAPVAERKAYFGDLHLHTSYSFDAYVMFPSRVTPEQAYRFAKGEPVPFLDKTVKRAEPLDFMAVTDHSENI